MKVALLQQWFPRPDREGGAERLSLILARALQGAGASVAAFELLPPEDRPQGLEGTELYQSPHPPASAEWRAWLVDSLGRSGADVALLGNAPLLPTCQKALSGLSVPLVYVISSDVEVAPWRFQRGLSPRELLQARWRWPAHERVRRALVGQRHIIANSQIQAGELLRRYGKECVLLPKPYERSGTAEERRRQVIWVGKRFKGVREITRLSRRLPDVEFLLVGAEGRTGGNVKWLGSVSNEETLRLVAASTACINSSPFEGGVPLTFLEAWDVRTLVLSLKVDPDGVLTEKGCGLLVRGLEGARRALGSLFEGRLDPTPYLDAGERRLSQEHDPVRVARLYLDYFERVVREPGQRRDT